MSAGGGFYSEQQERNFREANERVRLGGADAPECGARTRTGALCRALPLTGSARCIRHCGPKAAREFRERQWRDYRKGRLSHAVWTRAEARRAANRLRERWKKNPWHPGATINLGEYEHRFRLESGIGSRPADALPAAVLDFLRWKYRRLQIDRKRDAAWMGVLRDEFPRRLAAAGPCPPDMVALHERGLASVEALWRADEPATFSKRGNADVPKAPKRTKLGPSLRKTRVKDNSEDEDAVTRFIHEYREALAPHFERCRTDDERLAVVAAMRAYVANPDGRIVRERWLHTIRVLSDR